MFDSRCLNCRDLIAMIDDYVTGFVLKSDLEPGLEAIPAAVVPAAAGYFEQQLRSGDYPQLEAILGRDGDQWSNLVKILTAGSSADKRSERASPGCLTGWPSTSSDTQPESYHWSTSPSQR